LAPDDTLARNVAAVPEQGSERVRKVHHRPSRATRARDAVFAATDLPQSPWYVVQADDKQRARLNCIAHLLSVVSWKRIPQEKVKLPKRQKPHGYHPPDWPYRWIPEKY